MYVWPEQGAKIINSKLLDIMSNADIESSNNNNSIEPSLKTGKFMKF
mgnify:CR=1 FL=1